MFSIFFQNGFSGSTCVFTMRHTSSLRSQGSPILMSVFVWQNEPIIFSVSLKFETYYITGQWDNSKKKCYSMLWCNFFGIFLLLFLLLFVVKCVFLPFSFLFYKVSNFCNKILTSQKCELVVSNCQWNYMRPTMPHKIPSGFFVLK